MQRSGSVRLLTRSRVRAPIRSLAPLVCFVVLSCERPQRSPAVELSVVDEVPVLALVEELRIGSVEDPRTGFSWVGSLDIDRDGLLYVFEALFREIRVYSPTGQLLRTIGGPGEGPGEFRYDNVRFGVVGDVVWTWDGGGSFDPGRIAVFARDGRLISTAPVSRVPYSPSTTACVLIGPAALGPDSLFFGAPGGGPVSQARCEGSESPEVQPGVPMVRFRLDGTVADTVGFLPAGNERPPRVVRVGSSEYRLPEPPSDEPLFINLEDGWAVRVDRPVSSDPLEGHFTITRFEIGGDTTSQTSHRYVPVGYSEESLLEAAVRVAHSSSQPLVTATGAVILRHNPSDSSRARRVVRESMDFPAFQPPVQASRVGRDGALWLRREDTGEDVFSWLVLDEDGTPRGMLRLPRTGFRIGWSDRETAWAVDTDSLGIPWVVKYRIVEGPGG